MLYRLAIICLGDKKEALIKLLDNHYDYFSLWKCMIISEQW